jgi:hypothetical protein
MVLYLDAVVPHRQQAYTQCIQRHAQPLLYMVELPHVYTVHTCDRTLLVSA